MSVGVWDPSKGAESKSVDAATLERFTALANEISDATGVGDLEEAGVASDSWVMSLDSKAWQLATNLSSADIEQLIRLFTLLERQVPGWDAGNKSPVIPLVKLLKARNCFSPELRKWIKANTDNRYLPYGSAL